MDEVPQLTILTRLRELVADRGYPGRVEDGTICLGRQNGMFVCVSAAYGLDKEFCIRCIQELAASGETARYTIKLNGPREKPLAEYGYSPARGHHSHRFIGGRKVKNLHLQESGSLAKIADAIAREVESELSRHDGSPS